MILDGVIKSITFIPGKFWNVNNATLKNVSSVFCKNERALILCEKDNVNFLIIPVGTVLVGSIQINCIDQTLDSDVKEKEIFPTNKHYQKGDELGFFSYGSTVLVLLDNNATLNESLMTQDFIKMGQDIGAHI
jgi:phosphatidylserine decarboxylase